MADLRHRNPVLIPTSNDAYLDKAVSQQYDRELLYNRDDDTLGIILTKDGKKVRQIFKTPADEKNITYDSEGRITLADDIVVKSVTSLLDTDGLAWKSQALLKNTSNGNRILPLFKESINDEKAVIGGEILETSADGSVRSHYRISAVSPGSVAFKGEGGLKLVKAAVKESVYYAIQTSAAVDTSIYFTGWQAIPDALSPASLSLKADSDYSSITEVSAEYNNEFSSSSTLYIYNDNKTERAKVSSRGVRIEKKNSDDTWSFVGTFECDSAGNMFITNDEAVVISSVSSQMPKNSVVYHLDDDLLDESDQNSRGIAANDGKFISDDTMYLSGKAYSGDITIPVTTDDFAFFTKGNLKTSSGTLDIQGATVTVVESLAKKFNENKSTSWGLTSSQLASVTAVDEG